MLFPRMGTAGAWLGRSGEVGGAGLLYFLRGGRVLSEMPPKECAGMIYSPQDSLPGCTVPVLVWLAGTRCHGILNDVGQGERLFHLPGSIHPTNVSERQRGEIKRPQQGAHHHPKIWLDDARSETEREQEVGQVIHFG